jgi:ABC-2 type transport system ATP-binding protein
VHDLGVEHGQVSFTVDSDRVAGVLPALAQLGVQGLTVAPPSLEELFLRHYGDEAAGSPGEAAGSPGEPAPAVPAHSNGNGRHGRHAAPAGDEADASEEART